MIAAAAGEAGTGALGEHISDADFDALVAATSPEVVRGGAAFFADGGDTLDSLDMLLAAAEGLEALRLGSTDTTDTLADTPVINAAAALGRMLLDTTSSENMYVVPIGVRTSRHGKSTTLAAATTLTDTPAPARAPIARKPSIAVLAQHTQRTKRPAWFPRPPPTLHQPTCPAREITAPAEARSEPAPAEARSEPAPAEARSEEGCALADFAAVGRRKAAVQAAHGIAGILEQQAKVRGPRFGGATYKWA